MPTQTADGGYALFKRHPRNPLLTTDDWPYPVNTIFNAAATRLVSGETLLLCRVEERSGRSHLAAARSADGVTSWTVDPQSALLPDGAKYPEEKWGLEDPRAVWLAELGKYAVTYTCYGSGGPGVCLSLTADFKEFERVGIVFVPENKDAALLPRKIDGRWAMIHRPVWSAGGANIWMSFSHDLRHWGDHQMILNARHGPWWDAGKVGLSTPAIETPQGWLITYHGVKRTAAGSLYRVGLALLDLDDPTRCLQRGKEWNFTARTDYEFMGDAGNVVFPCGHTVGDDGDTLNLYYGAADTSMALATGSIREMLDWLRDNSYSTGILPD